MGVYIVRLPIPYSMAYHAPFSLFIHFSHPNGGADSRRRDNLVDIYAIDPPPKGETSCHLLGQRQLRHRPSIISAPYSTPLTPLLLLLC